MDVIAVDVETTISSKGNPFDVTNKFVLGAIGTNTYYKSFPSTNVPSKEINIDQDLTGKNVYIEHSHDDGAVFYINRETGL